MSQLSARGITSAVADLEKIRIKISNLAPRATTAALRAMRSEAEIVKGLASRFAPHKTGLLDDPDSWRIKETRTGINGRTELKIELRNGRSRMRGKKRVTLGMYAEYMQNGWSVYRPYSLGKGSRAKADALGLSQTPNASGNYVGWKFLSRALRVRRLQINTRVFKAVKSAIS